VYPKVLLHGLTALLYLPRKLLRVLVNTKIQCLPEYQLPRCLFC
jgi:hypothetical protein